MSKLEKETSMCITSYLEEYTRFINDVDELIEAYGVDEDKAKQLVIKRYPNLQSN